MNIKKKLSNLVKKKNIIITQSGNSAIYLSLKKVKEFGYSKLLIQNQGGWITYKQYAKKLKYELFELKTEYGILIESELKKYNNCVLLINSMPGYAYLQDMRKISEYCKNNNILLINDISGSIGHRESTYGDIIICSLGKNKPLGIGNGGFIGYNEEKYNIDIEDFELDEILLKNKIDNLKKNIKRYEFINKSIKKDLEDYNIINNSRTGYNVIILFSGAEEKERLINYCNKNNYEYTLCPRYIRVLNEAICIEVKRQ
ncbi:MAG: DegT/DnrJ/EryC1/StrS family aminotransferase [Candidatus Woesearchaeota archaeon]